MILVDREIAELTKNGGLLDSYDPDCLTNTGYDLRAKYFAIGGEKKTAAYLEPGESAFVASVDILTVPDDMLCRVVLKNSRIRQGFTLDAPVYQPGHQTRVFFRITNVSGNEIRLSAGEKYATLIFEQLTGVPDHPYAGAFSDEFEFSGLGKYQDIYEKQIRELEKKESSPKKKTTIKKGGIFLKQNTTLEILSNGLMDILLQAIGESGMSIIQAKEVPGYLSAAIDAKAEKILANERFSAAYDLP